MTKQLPILLLAAAVAVLPGCKQNKQSETVARGSSVMAREVPERMDDFVFENDLIAGRIYGKALEVETISPGIDIWVKLPGALVADDWYSHAVTDPSYYHHDHGGKDCYKVGTSLGGGASSPLAGGELCYPPTNWRKSEIISSSDDELTFRLSYPEWDAGGVKVRLEKDITVFSGSYFCMVEDRYYGDFDSISIAAGAWRHDVVDEMSASDRFAIWEKASDQSIEPEDGMIGVAVYMPGARSCTVISDGSGKEHSVCVKEVASGEPLVYFFGSCWSKGDIDSPAAWFGIVHSMEIPLSE